MNTTIKLLSEQSTELLINASNGRAHRLVTKLAGRIARHGKDFDKADWGKYTTLGRDSDGELSTYAWPGGYPIFYVDNENNTLCAKCANKPIDNMSLLPIMADINYEDPHMYCDECSERIESAYADEDSGE